ncbi:type II secretion system protein [Paenibacillus sp. YPG26]|uniref:type IV pilus modification PilV family protein n=1 Tax=Paenibacillus sp. YPG26 TaxID=2878915 RepID=UPI00203F8753|nr:type II secretion system protein [Paenibacillus sp. YPG26]USB33676.1 type II secretion system GspH family protein [Paenibacillus sp. YPG26]
MKKQLGSKDQGFSLIEVLAAITILSVVALVLSSYFTNSLSYSKKNQNKTIMVNLARNALFYMEKQSFSGLSEYFARTDTLKCTKKAEDAAQDCSGPADGLGTKEDIVRGVLNPTVNGISYNVSVQYQKDLHENMKHSADDETKRSSAKYLLPVKVIVQGLGDNGSRANETVVEGYITDETIR